MDRRAWWATVHGVAESQTRLTGLSTSTEQSPPLHTPLTATLSTPPLPHLFLSALAEGLYTIADGSVKY